MPQLDSALFFLESISLIMSFFSLVFYNQYVFYPKLLKNLFVRRFLIAHFKLNLIKMTQTNFLKIKSLNFFDLFYFKSSVMQLTKIVFFKSKNIFKKISFILNNKIRFLRLTLSLLISKLVWILISFRDFMLNYDIKI